jgi:hypothetical protein
VAETTWGETIIVDVTAVKPQEHIMELRNAVNRYRTHYGLAAKTFTDSDPTVMRKPYIDELRAQMDYLHKQAFNWTDPTITAGVTPVRKVHMDQLRSNMNHLETDHCWTCDLCNTEGCSSCVTDADGCGCHFFKCHLDNYCACDTELCFMDPYGCDTNILECTKCVKVGCYKDQTTCDCHGDAGCQCDEEGCEACHTAYNRIG